MIKNEQHIISEQAIASPCVRNCCLNNNDVCLGCFRHINEITGWRDFSIAQKIEVLQLCHQRRSQKAKQNVVLE